MNRLIRLYLTAILLRTVVWLITPLAARSEEDEPLPEAFENWLKEHGR